MKILTYVATALMVVATAEAKKNGNNRAKQNKQEELRKQKEKQEREDRRDAINDVIKEKDKNRDGSLTKEEYLVGEADAAAACKKFDEHNKNKDRYLSKTEIAEMLGL